MRPKHSIRRASLALAFAIAGCTITTSSPDSCSPDSTVSGCAQGSSGYSCTGSSTPPQSYPLLSCGPGTPGNASSTLYCCTATGADGGGTCALDTTASTCVAPSIGYSCTGSNTPPQTNSSLSCGSGAPGDAGSTLFCCTSNAAGADGGSDVGAEGGLDVMSDGGGGALVDGAYETGVDGGTCAVSADTGSPNCDQCIDSQCCTALVACGTPDAAGVDDAGASACEQLLGCTLDCLAGNPDAGLDAGSMGDCQALCNPSYTLSEQQNASALLQCQTASCSAQCQ